MHSDEGFVLSGRDGALVWRRDEIGNEWGCGGSWVAASDVDADGAEDVVSLYPVALSALSGKDGAEIHYRSMAADYFPSVWAAYGAPVIPVESEGDSKRRVYHALGHAAGVSTLPPARSWSTTNPTGFPGFADVDGDGDLDVVAYELQSPKGGDAPRRFVARVVEWGSEIAFLDWSLPGRPDLATVDVDSDGDRDLLFTAGNLLAALAVGEGRIERLWEISLEGDLGPPAVADIDRDGRAEILVLSSPGLLYVIDDADGGG